LRLRILLNKLTVTPTIYTFDSLGNDTAELVGGKGLNLGLMTRAGLPVPPGFCISSAAYRAALQCGSPLRISDALRDDILAAYRHLSASAAALVAVRSSATMEDGAEASFAGQQETILGVRGDEQLINAVLRCWRSLHTERAVAYRRKQKLDDAAIAMAVVVQQLVESEVSGVLFTHDPLDPHGKRMLIEAAPGLGESVVSGSVMPDRFHTDRDSGLVLDQEIHSQATMHTADGVREIAAELRSKACLKAEQLAELTRIGREIEAYYGEARDVEWAWANGRVYVLQARPITVAGASDVERVKQEEMTWLGARAERRGTVWAKYNLAEVLPEPTPMTWSIVRRFMSGSGGFGRMYRELGFDPDPELNDEGFIDLVCGRPYVNLSREPMLYFRDFPYGYDFAKLKADPSLAMYPTPAADRRRATRRTWLRLPAIFFRMWLAGRKMKRRAATHADRLRGEVYPAFVAQVKAARQQNLASLTPRQLVDFIHEWTRRTLVEFASESLQPSMFAATALADIEESLAPVLGPQVARGEAQALLSGVHPDAECDLPHALQAFSTGRMTRHQFLDLFGHRGPHEMELASPRWSEDDSTLPSYSPPSQGGAGGGSGTRTTEAPMPSSTSNTPGASPSPGSADLADLSLGERGAEGTGSGLPVVSNQALPDRWPLLADALLLDSGQRKQIEKSLNRARTYLALREASKHYLIMGMALMRTALVELDRRFKLNDGIFHLDLGELPRLIAGDSVGELKKLVDERRKRRRLALSIHVPPVLFSDDLAAIGRPVKVEGAAELKGTPVSFGVYEGDAMVLTEPVPADSVREGFVLVCPSTDPAWVPLFLKARGLVMETGGVLSHGAIVAREFGIPAVAGISEATHRLRTGQRLRVDGTTGIVHVYEK